MSPSQPSAQHPLNRPPPPTGSSPAAEIAESIAIVNAIGEHSAILANLAYANSVANTNLSQQSVVSNRQAMNELGLTVVAKAVDVLAHFEVRAASDIPADRSLAEQIADPHAVMKAFSAKSA